MKKYILILVAAFLTLASCKKEAIEPTPEPQPVAATQYTIKFLAGDYSAAYYTDIVIKVNGDSVGVLSSATTTMNSEGVNTAYNASGVFPNSLSVDVDLGSSYNIEAFTLSGDLIGSTGSKALTLVPDNDSNTGEDKLWLTDDVWNGNPGSPVGTSGNDCQFVGKPTTLLLLFQMES